MKPKIIRWMLGMLNSRWLNQSPCEYGYIGNVDAFSYSNLAAEEHSRPGITVKQILEEADRFRSCPIGKGLTVLNSWDGTTRQATALDVEDLRQSLSRQDESDAVQD